MEEINLSGLREGRNEQPPQWNEQGHCIGPRRSPVVLLEKMPEDIEGLVKELKSAVEEYERLVSETKTNIEKSEEARLAAENVRAMAERLRISAEELRASAEEGRTGSEADRVEAERLRNQAESLRVEAERLRASAEQGRSTAYTEAEAARNGLYQTAEAARNGLYQEAETARGTAYTTAEGLRDGEFEAKEATRDAANQAALNCADTLAALGPKIDEVENKATQSIGRQNYHLKDFSANMTGHINLFPNSSFKAGRYYLEISFNGLVDNDKVGSIKLSTDQSIATELDLPLYTTLGDKYIGFFDAAAIFQYIRITFARTTVFSESKGVTASIYSCDQYRINDDKSVLAVRNIGKSVGAISSEEYAANTTIITADDVNVGETISLKATQVIAGSGAIRVYDSNGGTIGTYTPQSGSTSVSLDLLVDAQFGKIDCLWGTLEVTLTTSHSNDNLYKVLFGDLLPNNFKKQLVELEGDTIASSAINSQGSIYNAGSDGYAVKKVDIAEYSSAVISASTRYANLYYAFYNSDMTLHTQGTAHSGSSADSITDVEVVVPSGAKYLCVGYLTNTTGAELGSVKVTGHYIPKGKWQGKKWACIGDSLTAENDCTRIHYFDYVAEDTGITTINMGVSGTGYARQSQSGGLPFYQRVSSIDTTVDVVTIFGSFNDLGAGKLIGDVDDDDDTTLAGCINLTITNLQTAYPLVNLGIVAPCPWSTTQPATEGRAYEYVEMMKAICERRSIPFLDLWRGSGLRPWEVAFRNLAYTKDATGLDGNPTGTHPDETGHSILAPKFKHFLEYLLM